MRKNLQIFHLPCQLEHTQRSADVAVHGLVDPRVEVNAGGAVDYYVAMLDELL